MWLHALYFVIGLLGLVAGAEWLVRGSASIAATRLSCASVIADSAPMARYTPREVQAAG